MNPEYIRKELAESIDGLPSIIYQEDPNACGVIRDWLRGLPLRYQGVLVTAIRGCDGAPKEDPSKCLNSMVRRAILNPADERETENERGFFGFSKSRLSKEVPEFLHSMDQYPMHYVLHICHACEVIGYHHPSPNMRRFFLLVYRLICHKMHVMPESDLQLRERLIADRVALGTTAKDF